MKYMARSVVHIIVSLCKIAFYVKQHNDLVIFVHRFYYSIIILTAKIRHIIYER